MSPAKIVLLALAGLVILFGVVVWLRAGVRYVVGKSSLRITWLGLTLRRIPYTDIRRVGTPKRDSTWLGTESWTNSWDTSHRGLVVHRRTGWRRRLLITPERRYAFRTELRAAIAKAVGEQPEPDADDQEDEE